MADRSAKSGGGDIETVTGLIDRNAEDYGDQAAVIYGAEEITHSDLRTLSLRAAQGLSELGIGPGDRVAFWLPNTIAYLALYLACARLGAIAVAVNTRFRSLEVSDIVERSGAKVMVLWPGFRNIDFLSILAEIPADVLNRLETVVLYDETGTSTELPPAIAGKNRTTYGELIASTPYTKDHARPEAGCNIFTTSGTTKAPKFVLHGQRGVALHAQDVWCNLAPIVGAGAFLQMLPICGVFGFTNVTAAIAGARPMVMASAFDAHEAVRLIDAHDVRYLNATDDMIMAMLAADPRDKALPNVVCCGYGAFNAAPEEVARRADARGLNLVGLYGMSEVQALFSRRDHHLPVAERYLPGGEIISPGARVRARDSETGEILVHGESGELELSGPSLMLEYFENPEATAEALTADGFIRSGDMGYTTGVDSFVFMARMGDTLRLGGFLVSPVEIESHLAEHPAIDGAQVVAVRVGEVARPYAFVTPAAGAAIDPEHLRRHCAESLAKFKVPVAFHAVEHFPTTKSANGTKIQRNKLRQMAEDAMAAQRQKAGD